MRIRICLLTFLFTFLSGTIATRAQTPLDAIINHDLASLVATYKVLHAAPELSHHEEKTAEFFATQLRGMGYTVTERVGKYEKPEWTGYGVVAVMKNGAGPTVLLRTELDALPVDERDACLWSRHSHNEHAGRSEGTRRIEGSMAGHARPDWPAC
jgi:metal-dependent amidase/aminoacylase/carboxypeptidase family protein